MIETHRGKADLRRMLRQRRAALSDTQQRNAAAALGDLVTTTLPAWVEARCIAIYLANDGEIDAEPLGIQARKAGKQVYLPVLAEGATLAFARWEDGAKLVENRYGIPEPPPAAARCPLAGLDIVFVPVVGWDTACNRLGMGGGYYDRTLTGARAPLLVGLAHECQRVEAIPRASWDIGMDYIATDAALYRREGQGESWPVTRGV